MKGKTKTVICLIMSLALLCTSALPVYAVSGQTPGSVEATEESDHAVSILNAGEWETVDESTLGKWDWTREDIPGQSGKKRVSLTKYNGSASRLIIPGTVTVSGKEYPVCLEDPGNANTVFPENVTEIRVLGATIDTPGDVFENSKITDAYFEKVSLI